MKVIILGGRSGTSAMYRLLRASFPACWGHTEPPGLADYILNNLTDKEALKFALRDLENYDLAKCPEFAFCTNLLLEMYPNSRFIWLDRPLIDRVESHKNLGWHKDISEKIEANETLKTTIRLKTNKNPDGNSEYNDLLYFRVCDEFNRYFEAKNPDKVLRIQYADFNGLFLHTMERVARFLNIQPNPRWRQEKQRKHQAGRWTPK